MNIHDVVVSSCAHPECGLEELLRTYSRIGYRNFEGFIEWTKSAFDISRDPGFYLDLANRHEMNYHSVHLPKVTEDYARSMECALRAMRFAAALGMKMVVLRAESRPLLIQAGKQLVDECDGLGLIPVLELHRSSAISNLQEVSEVLDGVQDQRLKVVLELGHMHSAGISWKEGYNFFKDRIAVVHLKDHQGTQCVGWGQGEIDLKAVLTQLKNDGYRGTFVVEMLVKDTENTERYLSEALKFLESFLEPDFSRPSEGR